MTIIAGQGMGAPKPQRRFDYPEGNTRICPMCRKQMTEGNGGTELSFHFDGQEKCYHLWFVAGMDKDGNPVVMEARFL